MRDARQVIVRGLARRRKGHAVAAKRVRGLDREGEMLVHMLLERGIAISTGSACSNGNDQPSHVITAMGIPYQLARNALRISFSRDSTELQVATVARFLSQNL